VNGRNALSPTRGGDTRVDARTIHTASGMHMGSAMSARALCGGRTRLPVELAVTCAQGACGVHTAAPSHPSSMASCVILPTVSIVPATAARSVCRLSFVWAAQTDGASSRGVTRSRCGSTPSHTLHPRHTTTVVVTPLRPLLPLNSKP
jgi:hypothetical protein